MRHRPQAPMLPGWAPLSQPAQPRFPWPRIAKEVAIWVALTVAVAMVGVPAGRWFWAAVFCGRALPVLLGNLRGVQLQALGFGVAAAGLAAIVAVAVSANPEPIKTPKLKAPVQVDAAQTDHLEDIRQGTVNLYAQLAQGFSFLPDPPKPKKEAH